MIEGTRMSVVFSICIRQLIAEIIEAGEKCGSPIAQVAKSWTHGVVYTPYSNYAGIYYLRDVEKVPLVLAKTGVKYVHHESIKFDFGKTRNKSLKIQVFTSNQTDMETSLLTD